MSDSHIVYYVIQVRELFVVEIKFRRRLSLCLKPVALFCYLAINSSEVGD